LVPSQSHSITMAAGAVRHCVSKTVRRLPRRGRAWKYAVSPRPMPASPLKMKIQKAAPAVPVPKMFAQTARKTNAAQMRQKLASTPPSRVAVRWAQTADRENSSVVSSAANIRKACGPSRRA
jgi:hypothetical protein